MREEGGLRRVSSDRRRGARRADAAHPGAEGGGALGAPAGSARPAEGGRAAERGRAHGAQEGLQELPGSREGGGEGREQGGGSEEERSSAAEWGGSQGPGKCPGTPAPPPSTLRRASLLQVDPAQVGESGLAGATGLYQVLRVHHHGPHAAHELRVFVLHGQGHEGAHSPGQVGLPGPAGETGRSSACGREP